jgi:hypothetical protein
LVLRGGAAPRVGGGRTAGASFSHAVFESGVPVLRVIGSRTQVGLMAAELLDSEFRSGDLIGSLDEIRAAIR